MKTIEQEATEAAERLQRFVIVRKYKNGTVDVIGTNGGLPFVEAAADNHLNRLVNLVGGSYHVVEIKKLGDTGVNEETAA